MPLEQEINKECPNCGEESLILDYSKGKIVCNACGIIVKDNIKDLGPEWRAFDEEEKSTKNRGGPPMNPMIHDKGLSTKIKGGSFDAKGNSMNPDQQQLAYRLRTWQRRTFKSDSKERSLSFAITEISKLCSQLQIPEKVAKSAAGIYRRASDKSLIRGRSREGVAAAVVYAACRLLKVPRTMEEISSASPVGRKEMRRSFMSLSRKLDLDIPPVDPVSFVNRYGKEMSLSNNVINRAIQIVREAQNESLVTGRNPRGVVGACLYLAALEKNEDITQKKVAEISSVTEVTIRNRFRELRDTLNIEVEK